MLRYIEQYISAVGNRTGPMPFENGVPRAEAAERASDVNKFSWPVGWEAVSEFISEGVVVSDVSRPSFPIVYVNRAFETLTGYGAGEVYGLNCRFLLGTDVHQAGCKVLRAALRDGQHAQVLLRNYRKDGRRFWNEVTLFPLRNLSGRVTHFVGIQHDVTARVEPDTHLAVMLENFKLSEGQLQVTFDSNVDGLAVVDSEWNVLRMNRAANELFDISGNTLTSEQVLGTFEVFWPDGTLVPKEERPTARALRGDFMRNVECTIRRKDTGRTIIVEISTAPVAGMYGNRSHFLISYHDVTASRVLAQSRARLAAIVESSQDAIVGKDVDGMITSWNRGAEKVFGYSAAEMIGNSIRKLLPERLVAEEDMILERIQLGETVEHFETERRTKSGRAIQVSLTISPIRDSAGKVIGASKIARDITEQKDLELQLRQSQKMEAIGQLTGGIAHDFNNLLGVIVGNLDLLERLVAGNVTALKRVHTAQKGAARGASLTRRLLAFSSKESLEPRSTVLAEAVHNTLELAASTIGPEIKIVTLLDSVLPEVFIDVAGLESALLNLVVNARDAMPKGGLLSISTKLRRLESTYPPVQADELKAGAYACLSVSDSGSGMSKDVLERALEPFFTTKPRNKGTGLGLAMVYGFAKQSGGTVRIYSEPDFGTTVSLYLPLASGPSLREVTPNEIQPNLIGTSALVVDDEHDLLDIAIAYLKDMGVTAHAAHDGAAALEILGQFPDVSLLVTDIIMPGSMSGVELARKVRQNFPAVRIIYCSGFPAESLAERSMPLVDGHLLRKPYQRAEFTRAIAACMQTSL